MTRREEIEKAANDYINSDAVSPMNMQLAFGDFINGAEWADKTMIEKACAFLFVKTKMSGSEIAAFRKAMEE